MSEENMLIYIEKAKNDDISAFEYIVSAHEKSIYNLVNKMLQNPHDSLDVVQDIFIKIFLNIKTFKGNSSFKTWLYRIAVNTTLDEIKKRKKRQGISIEDELQMEEGTVSLQFVDQRETPEEVLLQKEQRTYIKKALELLPEEHRIILVLRDIEGFSYEELSDVLQLQAGTVKSRLSRARNHFKKIYVNMEQTKLQSSPIEERRKRNDMRE